MEKEKIKCNRCSKEDDRWFEIEDTAHRKLGLESQTLKLCEECGKSFRKWMKN